MNNGTCLALISQKEVLNKNFYIILFIKNLHKKFLTHRFLDSQQIQTKFFNDAFVIIAIAFKFYDMRDVTRLAVQ